MLVLSIININLFLNAAKIVTLICALSDVETII